MYNLGVIAPMGLNFQQGFSYSAPLNIGQRQAWQDRVIEPRWPISSTGLPFEKLNPGLGVFTGGSYLPEESKVTTGGITEGLNESFESLMQGIDKILEEQNIELPDWMQQIYDGLPGHAQPENTEMPEVSVTPAAPPSFMDKYGKLLLWGGGAVAVLYMLKKG